MKKVSGKFSLRLGTFEFLYAPQSPTSLNFIGHSWVTPSLIGDRHIFCLLAFRLPCLDRDLHLENGRAEFSPEDISMNCGAWDSHHWSSVQGCRIEIEPGKPLIRRHCTRCMRDFAEDSSSGLRYAIYVSAFSFRRLPQPIAKQWLEELCPGAPLAYDIEVRSRLIEHGAKEIS